MANPAKQGRKIQNVPGLGARIVSKSFSWTGFDLHRQDTGKNENADQCIGKDMQTNAEADIFFPPNDISQACT
jgi:hypothetical protein